MRENRKKYSELNPIQKKHDDARSYLRLSIKRGVIKKERCCICGNEHVEAHHEDYDKPLEVIWYCRKHHIQYHNERTLLPSPGILNYKFKNEVKPETE